MQSPMLLTLEHEKQPNRRGEELLLPGFMALEEEEEVNQPFHTNGKRGLLQERSKQRVFGVGEGGAARKKKQIENRAPPPFI